MYISHKSNVIQSVHETEWQCRRLVKGLNKSEYWAWLDSVTSGDPPVVDLSGETGYTIVECTDEDVQARFVQLGDYVSSTLEGTTYNIKWTDDKVDGSHFTGDDSAKDARILAEQWTKIRYERTQLLTDTDYMGNSDVTMSADWKTYRQTLRDLPNAQKAKTTYASITWPSKP